MTVSEMRPHSGLETPALQRFGKIAGTRL
jgi:hypothetical protein